MGEELQSHKCDITLGETAKNELNTTVLYLLEVISLHYILDFAAFIYDEKKRIGEKVNAKNLTPENILRAEKLRFQVKQGFSFYSSPTAGTRSIELKRLSSSEEQGLAEKLFQPSDPSDLFSVALHAGIDQQMIFLVSRLQFLLG